MFSRFRSFDKLRSLQLGTRSGRCKAGTLNCYKFTHLVLAIYSLYSVLYGYSWCQALFTPYFDCYRGCYVTSQEIVATAKCYNIIMISQNCTTVTARSGTTTPLPRLHLIIKEKTESESMCGYSIFAWIQVVHFVLPEGA